MWFLSKQFKFCEFKKIYTSISDQRAYFCEKKFPSCSKNCMSFSRLAASIWHCSSKIIFVKSCCFCCAFSSAFIWTSCKSTNRSCKEIFSLFLEFREILFLKFSTPFFWAFVGNFKGLSASVDFFIFHLPEDITGAEEKVCWSQVGNWFALAKCMKDTCGRVKC